MWESILIIFGVMLLCAIFLSPFYFLRKKKVPLNNTEAHYSIIPLWKGMLFVLAEVLLFIALLSYVVLKSEGIDIGFLPIILILGALIFFHNKNRKIGFRKTEWWSFSLVEKIADKNKVLENTDTNAAPRPQTTPTVQEKRSSENTLVLRKNAKALWIKHKKKILIVGGIILIVTMWGYYHQLQQDERACLQRVYYRSGTIYKIENEGRNFKTQDEAMEYCLKVLK